MSINHGNNNLSYGFNNSLQTANPEYIFAQRAPTSNDTAAFGTFWFYKASATQMNMYIFASISQWIEIPLNNSGTPTFATLTVLGATLLEGSLNVNSGTAAINIGTDAAAKTITLGNSTGATSVVINSGTGAINIGTNAIAHTITVGNVTGATAVDLNAGTGGIVLNANATGNVSLVSQTATSATTSVTNNSKIGSSTITGLTTASSATVTITLSNSSVTAANCVLVSASNLDASGNHAAIGIQSIVQASGSLKITLINNGAGALGSGDNVLISHMVLG